ncbi:GEM-like protein 2 [Ziziphus jujuba]|uniref:GEM-like protein 2 n=1 Tax=Ziziphus jujuba TaxID=326968 RepID=A0A6P4A8R0_ZIZJJ|nr:GEM-like protein 2 [Ziziphus jujuba]
MNTYSTPPSTADYNNHSVSPYVQLSNSSGRRPMVKMFGVFNRCGKTVEDATRKAENIADNFWHHLKVSSSFTDAAMARLAQGTKVLAEGGHDKVFHQTFHNLPGEKLLHTYACYLSTTTGPVIGTLYISNRRIAFCSDFPLSLYSPAGNPESMYYKVVVQIDQLRAVNPCANRWNPSEKYIHMVTRDDHQFWFMGFISYDKAIKNLNEVLHQSRGENPGELRRQI